MSNRSIDIADYLDGYDTTVLEFVKKLMSRSYKEVPRIDDLSKGIRLYTIAEDEYVQAILDILFHAGDNQNEKIKIKTYLIVDLSDLISSSIFSSELSMSVIEKIIFRCWFQYNFTINFLLDKSWFKDATGVSELYETVEDFISSGIISGNDIVHFIDRDNTVNYIYSNIIDKLSKTLIESFTGMGVDYKKNMLFPVGWVGSKLHFMEVVTSSDVL